MNYYIDEEMCKQCKGACCRQTGCVYLPSDFKNMKYDYLLKQINKGFITISGQPTGFYGSYWTYILYLRARNINGSTVELFTKGGQCIHLKEDGCALDIEKRPSCGKLVKPVVIGGPCDNSESIKYSNDWLNYSQVLKRLVKFYTNKNLVDIIQNQLKESLTNINEKIKNNISLTSSEEQIVIWYTQMIRENTYLDVEEVKKLIK